MHLIKIYDVLKPEIYETEDGYYFINVKADVEGEGSIVDFSFFLTEPSEGEVIIRHFRSSEGLYPIFCPVAIEEDYE